MFLINAWFFITNVIYIDCDKEYIFIERSCWNTMVHLLWKKRKPIPYELQAFKTVCYQIYLQFSNTGKIDHKLFNTTIKNIQMEQFNFAPGDESYSRTIVDPSKDVITNDQTEFNCDSYLDNSVPELSSNSLSIMTELSHKLGDFEYELDLFINYMKSLSVGYDALTMIVGFGRIKSIFKILLLEGKIKLHNEYEYQVVEFAMYYGIGSKIISMLNYSNCESCDKSNNCDNHIRYFMICKECNTVNCHRKKNHKRLGYTISDTLCKNFFWFCNTGRILPSSHVTLNENNFQIGEHSISYRSNINYTAVLHNIVSYENKKKQLENDKVYTGMKQKQIQGRSFSGFSLSKETLDRKQELLNFNKKSEVFVVKRNFSSEISPTKTLNENNFQFVKLKSDNDFVSSLKSPSNILTPVKSVFKSGDICPDCDFKFTEFLGSLKCKCRTISTSFSLGKFTL